MIKAIVFDFDGTLANTIFSVREGVNATMRAFGFPEHDVAAVTSFINTGARELLRKAIPADRQRDEALLDRVMEVYDAAYAEVCCENVPLYDGMGELLLSLKQSFKIGVLSNKQDRFVKEIIAKLYPEDLFDEVHGQLEYPAKPDPTAALAIAKSLKVPVEECMFCGDSDVDILTAKNAEMVPLGVSWGYRPAEVLRQVGAELIARTPADIPAFFEKYAGRF